MNYIILKNTKTGKEYEYSLSTGGYGFYELFSKEDMKETWPAPTGVSTIWEMVSCDEDYKTVLSKLNDVN